MSDVSTTWPRPVCSRARSATMTANAVASAGDAVGERERRQQRRAVGLAVQRGEAAHRLGERAEARAARAYGPVWPKPLTRASTSRGLTARSSSGPDAPALERARAEVLEHDVGALGQPQEEVAAVRLREVERDRAACCGRAP